MQGTIKVYTRERFITNGKRLIKYPEKHFDSNITELTEKEMDFIDSLEGVKCKDNKNIVTEFGTHELRDFPSEIKIVTCFMRYPDSVVDITELGEEIIKHMFELIQDTDIEVMLRHSNIEDLYYKYLFEVDDYFGADDIVGMVGDGFEFFGYLIDRIKEDRNMD